MSRASNDRVRLLIVGNQFLGDEFARSSEPRRLLQMSPVTVAWPFMAEIAQEFDDAYPDSLPPVAITGETFTSVDQFRARVHEVAAETARAAQELGWYAE